MKMSFVVREGSERNVVAEVTSDLEWSGDEKVIELVKSVLKGRKLDLSKEKDFAKVPEVFSGSYFWASQSEEEDAGGVEGSS